MGYFRPDQLPRDPEAIEARKDARLLLMVARARLRLGELPFDLAPRLDAVSRDDRIPVRKRRIAAELGARLALGALGRPDATGARMS